LDVPVNDDADLKRRWDYQLKLYDMERNIYLLCNIKDHKEYFEKIRDGRYTLLISSHGDLSELWTEELQRDFEKLTGSTMDFRDLGGSSAVVLSSDGKVLDELADPADCRIGGELPGNISFSIRGNVDSASRIRVDRTILKITRYTGLQIVVFDNELGWVVDCVNVMPGLQDDVTSETKAAIIIRNNPFKKKFYIKMKDYIDMKMAVL
ncbi:MAG: hypothetical protein IJH38_09050, partial [Clostridia bacterium]|nr:hypothetical protein [Clostridia bacterium]